MTWRAMWDQAAFPGFDYADFATEDAAHRKACEVVRETGEPVKVREIDQSAPNRPATGSRSDEQPSGVVRDAKGGMKP